MSHRHSGLILPCVLLGAACSQQTSPHHPPDATASLRLLAGGVGGPGHLDGPLSEARFFSIESMTALGPQDVIVVDDGTIRRVDFASSRVTTVAGAPQQYDHVDGIGPAARFGKGPRVIGDGAGTLYVADRSSAVVRKVVLQTGEVSTVAGRPGVSGRLDGIGEQARFDFGFYTGRLALDGSQSVYVTEGQYVGADMTLRIRKVDLLSRQVTTVPFTLSPTIDSGSIDLAADGRGNLYLTAAMATTGMPGGPQQLPLIRRIVAATGELSVAVGCSTAEPCASFVTKGMVSDRQDRSFLFDEQPIWERGTIVRTRCLLLEANLSTHGFMELAGDDCAVGNAADGIGSQARFGRDYPTLAADGAGHVYVGEMAMSNLQTDNAALLRLRVTDQGTGQVSTPFTESVHTGNADGAGSDARFDRPTSVASDGAGHLFVFDSYNHSVRRIEVDSGQVTTFMDYASDSTVGGGAVLAADQRELFIARNAYASPTSTIARVDLASGAEVTVDTIAGQPAQFAPVVGLAVAGDGTLFLAEQLAEQSTDQGATLPLRCRIARVSPYEPQQAPNGSTTIAMFERPQRLFGRPVAMAASASGALYFGTDEAAQRVDLSTGAITTVATGFTDLRALAVDGRGDLLALEGNTVRRISPGEGRSALLVGARDRIGVVLGQGAQAALNDPWSMATTSDGTIAIVDRAENAVVVLQP